MDLLTVQRGRTAVRVHPSDGGKIVSLRHRGHEWLAPSTSRDADGEYGGGGGWDECVPTIAVCLTPDGTLLRDHGEAWRTGWDVVSLSADSVTVAAGIMGLRFSREIAVLDGAVQLSYRVSAHEATQVVYWAAHPLFAAPPGTILTHTGIVDRWLPVGESSPPRDGRIDELPRGTAIKAFVSAMSMVALTVPGRGRLETRWSSAVTWVGLYWDNSLFIPGQPVIAIEPTFARDDSAAMVWDDLPRVEPGKPLDWELRLDFR